MKQLKLIISFCFLLATYSSKAGFPLGKGGYMIVPTYFHYTAKGYWDQDRIYKPFDNVGDKFTSNYFGVFGGFGLGRDLDFMYNIPFVVQTSITNGAVTRNSGLGDATLGLKYFLTHFEGDRHLSVQGSFIVPLYQNLPTKLPFIGFQETGFEGKLCYAGGKEIMYRNAFYEIEGGFRQFFGVSGPFQLFTNITGGIELNEYWKLSGNFAFINSKSTNAITNLPVNLFGNRDFSFTRLTANLGYILNPNTTVYGSLFTDIAGRNTGKGSGFGLFAVIKF